MTLRFLVVDGNPRDRREAHRQDFGLTPGDAYGRALLEWAPAGSRYDVCLPADDGANLPQGAGIADYDGVALTGSSLHLWKREPAVDRQIALAQEVFAEGPAFFGSCWGIQMASVAAGGDVQKNPLGREIGFARQITPTDAGRVHPMLAGRPPSFTAPAIHLDIVSQTAPGTTILAQNALSPVQAAEIRHGKGVFWGVQYHPEFSLTETATILRRLADGMTMEGFTRSPDDALAFADELTALEGPEPRPDLAWRHGLDAEVLDASRRMTEIRNWIEWQVKPQASSRGRA